MFSSEKRDWIKAFNDLYKDIYDIEREIPEKRFLISVCDCLRDELAKIRSAEFDTLGDLLIDVVSDLESRMSEIEKKIEKSTYSSRVLIKNDRDSLEEFYKNKFRLYADPDRLAEQLTNSGIEGVTYKDWAQEKDKVTVEKVRKLLLKMIAEKTKYDVLAENGIPIDHGGDDNVLGELWQVGFSDTRPLTSDGKKVDEKTSRALFTDEAYQPGDDFDWYHDEILVPRAGPALVYKPWYMSNIQHFDFLISRIDGVETPLDWWKDKLAKHTNEFALVDCLTGLYRNKLTLVTLRTGIPITTCKYLKSWKEDYDSLKGEYSLHSYPEVEKSDFEPYIG